MYKKKYLSSEEEQEDELCKEQDEPNCNIFFIYNRKQLEPVIRVEKKCTDPINVVGKQFLFIFSICLFYRAI